MGPRARCAVIFEPSLPVRPRAHDLRLTFLPPTFAKPDRLSRR
jgi:hypothetical protein